MADTDAYPVDAAVANRATGYTRDDGKLTDNRRQLPWRGTSAGGGYSTVDDLRRFADALRAGKLGGARGRARHRGRRAGRERGPGDGRRLHAGGDGEPRSPGGVARGPAGARMARAAGRRGPTRGASRRRATPAVPAIPSTAPRTTVLPADGADVPMLRSGHMPAVHVMLNGQGPFLFAIDTGGAGTARVDTALAERLGLAKVGEARGGDPSGRNARTMALVAIDSLQIGGARFEGLQAAVRDMREMPLGEKVDGILGFGLFAGCLLTLDYPANVVRMARGELPPANGRDVLAFTRERGIPTARITVAGREMDAHVDAGFMGGISLPEAEAGRLPLSAPAEGRRPRPDPRQHLRDQGRAARRQRAPSGPSCSSARWWSSSPCSPWPTSARASSATSWSRSTRRTTGCG